MLIGKEELVFVDSDKLCINDVWIMLIGKEELAFVDSDKLCINDVHLAKGRFNLMINSYYSSKCLTPTRTDGCSCQKWPSKFRFSIY